MSAWRLPGDYRRGPVLIALVALALIAGLAGALVARAQSRDAAAPACIPYSTGRVPASTRCMDLPWQLVEAGPGARSLLITTAQDCFSSAKGEAVAPRPIVHETRSAIGVRLYARGYPVLDHHGRLQKGCGSYELTVALPEPIRGRSIQVHSWPAPVHPGTLRNHTFGLPRLLGLSPAQALRVLSIDGFRGQVIGHGNQVVAQLPGWGLTTEMSRPKPDPYNGVATLTAGDRISIPATPAVKPGSPTGLLVARLSDSYSSRAEPVALFDSHGRLLARLRVPGERASRIRLARGGYLLLSDNEARISCPPASVRVRARQTTRVTVPFGCDGTL